MIKHIFLAVLIIISVDLQSQNLGDTKQTVVTTIKTKYKKDSLVIRDTVIKSFSRLTKGEYQVFKFNKKLICDTIEQNGPNSIMDFYISTLGVTMMQRNDSTWMIDKGTIRKTAVLHKKPSNFKIVYTQKSLSFIK